MFTFKKFAAIGVAAFTALTISSCSDTEDDEEEGSSKPSFNVGAGEVVLGGINSTDGSSLDIDANDKVYKLSEVTSSIANEIDVIFDGTNVWTPNSVKSSSVSSLKSKYTSSTSTALIFNVPASAETDDDLIDAFQNAPDEDAVVVASKDKKFGVLSSTGSILALVTIKDKDGENVLLKLLKVE